MVCSNCGGYHPTNRCKKPDKVIPLNPPPGDYQKQARDNMRGVRFPEPMATNGPPNFFYDHQNHRQTHNTPAMLQTNQGIIHLPQPQGQGLNPPVQGSQDVRFAKVQQNFTPVHEIILPHSNLVQGGEFAKCLNTLELPALVATRGMVIKSPLIEHEEEAISIDSSEDSPHFSEFNETTKQLAGDMRKDDMPSTIVEPDEADYQFLPVDGSWGSGHRHQGKLTLLKPTILRSLMICGKTYARPRLTSRLANSFKLHHLLGRR